MAAAPAMPARTGAGDAVASTFASTQGEPKLVSIAQPTAEIPTYKRSSQAPRRQAVTNAHTAAAQRIAIRTYVGPMSPGRPRKLPIGQIPKNWRALKGPLRLPNSVALVSVWLAGPRNALAVRSVGTESANVSATKAAALIRNARAGMRTASPRAGKRASPSQTPPPTLSTPSAAEAATARGMRLLAAPGSHNAFTTRAAS